MYPYTKAEMPLQSHLFGHRLKYGQTKYEYLLEFLLVALSPKSLQNKQQGEAMFQEMFPLDDRIKTMNLRYYPVVSMGLKRFIFFPNGTVEGRASIDKEAYESLLGDLRENMDCNSREQELLFLLENLFTGYTATEESRAWSSQCLLPICPEVIFPESTISKKNRVPSPSQHNSINIDFDFDFTKRNFFTRGGEIYYLHLLQGIEAHPEYQKTLESQIMALLQAYPAFGRLSQFIQHTWENYRSTLDDQEKKEVKLDLRGIPEGFSRRSHYTLSELKNLLESNCHPFEKMELLANGLLIQMLAMMYQKAGTESFGNYWVIDVNAPDFDNKEMKKFAQNQYLKNEDKIKEHLYEGFQQFHDKLKEQDEKKAIENACKNSVDVFRKLGKKIGLITPITGPGMRFTLSEDLIKFLVLALIPPSSMMTLDDFLDLLHRQFNMVIGPDAYKKEAEQTGQLAELSFLEDNKVAFAQKMKDCGFLRDLSDAIAIVENPYPKKELCV